MVGGLSVRGYQRCGRMDRRGAARQSGPRQDRARQRGETVQAEAIETSGGIMRLTAIAAAALLLAGTTAPRAEISEITVAQQFGVSFLPLMLMERDSLIEKHAKAAGIELKTNWQKVAGPSVINDGLLSGNVHFGAVGAPSLITLWWRTKGNVGVKGVAAMTSYPLYFVTRNPDLKSLKELSSKDKIAVPSVKISTQAIMLQMAAADLFGQPNYQKFDEYTVSLSHPDAMVALMNNTSGVNAHFA